MTKTILQVMVLMTLASSAFAGNGEIGSANGETCGPAARAYLDQLKGDRGLRTKRLNEFAEWIQQTDQHAKLPACEDLKEIEISSDVCSAFRCGEIQFTTAYLVMENFETMVPVANRSILASVVITEIGAETTRTQVKVSYQELQEKK